MYNMEIVLVISLGALVYVAVYGSIDILKQTKKPK